MKMTLTLKCHLQNWMNFAASAAGEWATGSLADVDAENGIHPEVTVSGWWFGT